MQAAEAIRTGLHCRLRETAGYRTGHLRPGATIRTDTQFSTRTRHGTRTPHSLRRETSRIRTADHLRIYLLPLAGRYRKRSTMIVFRNRCMPLAPCPNGISFGFGEGLSAVRDSSQRLHQPWRLVARGVRTVCRDFPADALLPRPVAGTVPQGCRTFGIPSPLSLDRTGGYYEKHGYDYDRRRIRPGRRRYQSIVSTYVPPALLASGGYVVRPERPGEEGGTLPPRPDGFRNSDGQRRDGTGFRRPAATAGTTFGTRPCGDLQRPVAHVMFTRTRVERQAAGSSRSCSSHRSSMLAPPRHRPGRGTARRGHAAGPRHGIRRSIPMRQSAYYHRFGFRSTTRYGISLSDIHRNFVMAAELRPGHCKA